MHFYYKNDIVNHYTTKNVYKYGQACIKLTLFVLDINLLKLCNFLG